MNKIRYYICLLVGAMIIGTFQLGIPLTFFLAFTWDYFYRGFIMINNINELAEKGLRPCVLPQMSGGKWFWCVGVYIGNNTRAEWLRNHTEEGGPIGGYSDYYEALDAAIAYCNNYKPKIEHASKKVSKR